MTPAELAGGKCPKRRAKSYLLQEAEAVSRATKLEWCRDNHIQVLGLQHDGIMCAHAPDAAAAANEMSLWATAACGYPVTVEHATVGKRPLLVE